MNKKQLVSARLVQPSENNSLKAPVVVVKFVGSELPAYFTPSYFDGLCLNIGLMSAMVFSSPASFEMTAEFVIRKEGETYTKSDDTEGIASSTSLRVSKATIGMNVAAFGAVMAATNAQAQPQNSTAVAEETVEETVEDEIPEGELEITNESAEEPK